MKKKNNHDTFMEIGKRGENQEIMRKTGNEVAFLGKKQSFSIIFSDHCFPAWEMI